MCKRVAERERKPWLENIPLPAAWVMQLHLVCPSVKVHLHAMIELSFKTGLCIKD